MLSFDLLPNEVSVLNAWASSRNRRLAIRAQIMQSVQTGVATQQIARDFRINEQRIYLLIDRFKSEGLLGLLEEPREGRPPSLSVERSEILLDLLSESNLPSDVLPEFASKFGVSADTIWRRARLTRKNLTRFIRRDALVTVTPFESARFLGILASSDVCISVTSLYQTANAPISVRGVWDVSRMRPLPPLSNIDLMTAFDLTAKAEYRTTNVLFRKNRPLSELFHRWLKMVGDTAKVNRSFSINITGEFSSENMLFCLQAIKQFIYKERVGQSTVTFSPAIRHWLADLLPADVDALSRQKLAKRINSIRKRPEAVFAWSCKINN